MPLKNFRQIFMPYCLSKQADGSWVILNRDYKPIGFRTRAHVNYEDYPIAVRFKKLTPAILKKVSFEPISADPSQVWLYNDGCLPNESSANMQAYLTRISYLMDLEAEGETPPVLPTMPSRDEEPVR